VDRLASRLTAPIRAAALALFLLWSGAAVSEAADGGANQQTPQAANFENTRASLDFGFMGRLLHPNSETGATPEDQPKRPNRSVVLIKPSGSLIAALGPGVPARRAAALRLEEKGRRFLLNGAYEHSLIYFEKALGLDADPYVYFYLAKAHYHLAHLRDSLQFLDVAANLLDDRQDWMAEINALRAELTIAARKARHEVKPVAMPLR
jgi:tetratricopeptide (TPR) repeat protein